MTDSVEWPEGPESVFRVTIVTLFPEFFEGPLQTSLLGKAIDRGDIAVDFINPRDFTTDKHRTVDDTPYGGGPGMVLKPEPMVQAIEAARWSNPSAPVVLLTPQGEPFSANLAAEMADRLGIILVCGRYEGFDDRIREYVDAELTVGDYVLSGGEPAAVIVLDSVSREREGVLGNAESTRSESFADGLLEYPQYTRPVKYRGLRVPPILLSGDHGQIEKWRRAQALIRTRVRRPDLYEKFAIESEDLTLQRDWAGWPGEKEKDDGRETVNRED